MTTMTSARGSINLLSVMLVLVICRDVQSDLIVKPKDSEAVVGGTTFFNCSSTLASTEIHWFHYAVGDTKDRSFVYGYEQFYSPYLGRFQMEKNAATGAYNLIISSVTIDDAGRFECQDDTGRGDKDSAQLTVLEENPVCQSNIKPQGLIGPNICGFEPEELHLTCVVQYRGNQPPIMQWEKVGSDNPIIEGVTQNISSNRAIYYLQMEVNSRMHGSSYQCQTTRSATSQYGCTSDVVKLLGFDRASAIAVIIVVEVCIIIITAVIVGLLFAKIQQRRQMKLKDSSKHEQHPSTRKEPEQIELIEPQEKETIEKLTTENKRLLAKVHELEQLMYSSDNKGNKTAANFVHTIVTKAAKGDAPITGLAILENSLLVVKKNCPVVEVYDSKTFVFDRLIEKLPFTNPLDIASSEEDKFIYILNRENSESTNNILKFKITGEVVKIWEIENDDGRLSTYESNLIVCFCAKRIIKEYTPEAETVNTVRLSPGNGFNNIWHAVKLTGTRFVVSHSKVGDAQRVCVVDRDGKVLAAFEELPTTLDTLFNKAYDPICLVGHRNESVLVADARNKRVFRLSPKELQYERMLLETHKDHIPVRLCLNETRDRVFVGVNCGDYSNSETLKGGRILIYNIRK